MTRISKHTASIRRALAARLRDRRGFMLAEQLVSIILIGLLCIAITAGLSAAMSAYFSITRQTAADTLLARAIETVNDELVYSTNPEASSFDSPSRKARVQITSTDEGIVMQGNGIKTGNATAAESLVIVKSSADPAFTPGFAEGKAPIYNAADNTWSYTINITETGSVSGPVVQKDVTVKRVMPAPQNAEDGSGT